MCRNFIKIITQMLKNGIEPSNRSKTNRDDFLV